MNNKQVIAQAVLVLSLTACGSSGDGGNSTANSNSNNGSDASGNGGATNNGGGADNGGNSSNRNGNSNSGSDRYFYGTVTATDFRQTGVSLFGGDFFSDTEQFTAQQLLNQLQSDSCILNDEDEDDGLTDNSVDISAGETIIISGNGGTVSTLTRESFGGLISYLSPQISGSLPAGLVADIPGDVFPAFSGISFPAVQTVQLNSPTIDTIFTASDQINWTPGNTSSSAVLIDIEFENQFGETSSVECEVRDDGNFSLPSSIVDRIGADLEATEFDFVRTVFNFTQSGNALLSTATVTGVILEY